jgi:hypothetical protein
MLGLHYGGWTDPTLVLATQLSHDTYLFRFGLPTKSHVLGLPIGKHFKVRPRLCIRSKWYRKEWCTIRTTCRNMVDAAAEFSACCNFSMRTLQVFGKMPEPKKKMEWNGREDQEQIDPSHDGLIERKYTPTSSDDDLGHFDLIVKVTMLLPSTTSAPSLTHEHVGSKTLETLQTGL